MAFNPSYPGYGGVPGGYGPPASLAPSFVAAPSMPQPLPYSCQPVMPQPPMPTYGGPIAMPQPSAVVGPPIPRPLGFSAPTVPYGGGPAPYPPAIGLTGAVSGMWGAPAPAIGLLAPPPGVSAELWNWFQAVDVDHNGHITASELQMALVNGNWTPFNPETCRLLVGMFDVNRSGTIDVHEFVAMWKYIQDWKACFDRFDMNRSGNIDANELQNALRTFGYSLSMNFVYLCVRIFDKRCNRSINFDAFIQCCVMLKLLSERFREKDTKLGGVATVHYEEFLRMALDNPIM